MKTLNQCECSTLSSEGHSAACGNPKLLPTRNEGIPTVASGGESRREV